MTASALDQVQVIAYGTATKRLNTGDVTTIISKEIEEQPVSSPVLALEGRVSGMSITQSSGSPLKELNPEDIESVDLLKDADAAAICAS